MEKYAIMFAAPYEDAERVGATDTQLILAVHKFLIEAATAPLPFVVFDVERDIRDRYIVVSAVFLGIPTLAMSMREMVPYRDALKIPLDHLAPQCCVCGKKGLSVKEGDGGGECELSDGRWVCSRECWEKGVDPEVPDDVKALVIAARAVAFGEPSDENIKALDKASEAFASAVSWENENDGT